MKKKLLSALMLFASFGVISTLTSCNHIIELNSKAEIKLTLEDVENKTLEVGETLTLNLKVENTNKKATFVSSNEEVLTINENGVVEAKSVGSAKIYALIQDEKELKSNSLEFNVLAKSDIKVILDVETPMLIVNETFDLKPTITGNINNYPVSYISSDTTVAAIDNNGKITALKEGKTKISVVIKNIERASIEFNIFNSYVPCENISLKEKQIFLSINEEYEVNPTYSPMNSIKGFTLTSEDTESVKVEGNKIIGLEETYSPVKVTITSGNATFELLVTVVDGENAKIIEEVKAKLDTSLSLEPTLAKDGNLTISKLNEQNEETSKKVYDFEVYNDNKTSTIYTDNGFVNRYTAAIEGNIFVNSIETKTNDGFTFDDFANKKIGDNSGEMKEENALKQANLPIVGGSLPNGLSKYIKNNYFNYNKYDTSGYFDVANYSKNGEIYTFNVTQEDKYNKKIMSATIEFDDGLIKSFTSTITSYTNYDDKNINFEFFETEKVTATMNKGTKEKSTSLPDFSKLICTNFELKFLNKGEAKTEFSVGDVVSIDIKGEPSTYNSKFDPINIKLSSPSVARYNTTKHTLTLMKECNELKITASTFNVTKEYTLKINALPVKSLSIESSEMGLANNTISGKINVNPSKASSDLEYEIISGDKTKVNIVSNPGTTNNAPSFKFTATEANKYTLKVTDKLTNVSTTKDITIFEDSDEGIISLIKACNITSDNEYLSNFNLTFDSENTGTISFTYNMEDKNSSRNNLDFNQKFTISNKTISLDSSSTTHYIDTFEFDTNLDGSKDYSTLKLKCHNSKTDLTENSIILSLNLK